MAYSRQHSHLRYATPASAAYPIARSRRSKPRDSSTRSLTDTVPGESLRGFFIAVPISLALWAMIGAAIHLVL